MQPQNSYLILTTDYFKIYIVSLLNHVDRVIRLDFMKKNLHRFNTKVCIIVYIRL